MSISSINRALFAALIFVAFGCKREVVQQYEVNEINLYASASEKKNLKTDEQFISILYSDLFETAISNSKLQQLNQAYTSMGDKSLVIDILIKSLLADSGAKVPSNNEMRQDPKTFVQEAYKKLMVRKPTAQEEWFLVNKIQENESLSAVDIYYAMLTSDEYRYY